jgi:hypothetical protein
VQDGLMYEAKVIHELRDAVRAVNNSHQNKTKPSRRPIVRREEEEEEVLLAYNK